MKSITLILAWLFVGSLFAQTNKQQAYIFEWCSANNQVVSTFNNSKGRLICGPEGDRQVMQKYLAADLMKRVAAGEKSALAELKSRTMEKQPFFSAINFDSVRVLPKRRYLIATEKGLILLRLAPFEKPD